MAVWLDMMLAPLLRKYAMTAVLPVLTAEPQGRIKLGLSRYEAALQSVVDTETRAALLGHSPGYVAARWGVSRQAVYDAIDRKRLTAIYVYDDRRGKVFSDLVMIIITPQSVEWAEQNRYVRRGKKAAAG